MKFEKTDVWGFEHAVRGMRNPLNSWDKSDSDVLYHAFQNFSDDDPMANRYKEWNDRFGLNFLFGKADLDLAQRLIIGGTEHRKFMRQIMVSVDITAPDYFFKEFDTYRIGVTENSTSTMHKIMSKEFVPEMFECSGMRGYKVDVLQTPNEIDEDSELWKIHPKYKDYEISNQGRVKHLSYYDTGGITRKERIIAGSLHQDGYVVISICLGFQHYKQVPKHRLVAETWIDNPCNLKEVNHKDGNKQNNSVENLEWCSSSENQVHAVEHGLQPKPICTYKGKLSKEQRDEIIKRFSCENISRRELARQYDVSHTTINALLNNKYNYGENICNEYELFLKHLDILNELRDEYLITQDKEVWRTLIQMLPMNYLYTRTVTMNYENLRSMYFQRRGHKLSEWLAFRTWIESLPYANELITFEDRRETE